jgi:hypothetical protein
MKKYENNQKEIEQLKVNFNKKISEKSNEIQKIKENNSKEKKEKEKEEKNEEIEKLKLEKNNIENE